jgi:hypothetical protein
MSSTIFPEKNFEIFRLQIRTLSVTVFLQKKLKFFAKISLILLRQDRERRLPNGNAFSASIIAEKSKPSDAESPQLFQMPP